MKAVLSLFALFIALAISPAAAAKDIAVPVEVLEARIKAALPASARTKDYNLRLNNAGRIFQIPAEAGFDQVTVGRVIYDDRSGSFNATLVLPGADGPRQESITGRTEEVMTVPVLAKSLNPGDIIAKNDIAWTEVSARQVTRGMAVSADDILGMAVRRPLRADSPIRMTDIERPVLVKRGSLVTMLVATERLTLTATGRALSDGAKGDRIHITNTSSNTTVEGVVVSAREVRIVTGSRLAGLSH